MVPFIYSHSGGRERNGDSKEQKETQTTRPTIEKKKRGERESEAKRDRRAGGKITQRSQR